jgi:hypothetical protein
LYPLSNDISQLYCAPVRKAHCYDHIERTTRTLEHIMSNRKTFPDPANARAILDEADIGSGEKTPAEKETEEMIRQIPPLPASGNKKTGDEDDDNESASSSGFDAREAKGRREHDASLERDEPSEELDNLDPVPPEGQ